jgi:tetratricopeptide (TPR) repeat protein
MWQRILFIGLGAAGVLLLPERAAGQPGNPGSFTVVELQRENTELFRMACRLRYGAQEPAKNEEAAKGLLEQFARDSANAEVRTQLATAAEKFFCAGALEQAASIFEKLGADKRVAAVRMEQRRPADALALCEKVLRANPNDGEALGLRASLLLDEGRRERVPEIVADLRRASSLLPRDFVIHGALGRALLAAGDPRAAQAAFAESVRLQPEYVPGLAGVAALELSRGEFNAAANTATEILRLRPENTFARLVQAASYLRQNRMDEAEAVLEEAVRRDSDSKEAKYQLGFVRFRLGKMDDAQALFQEVYGYPSPQVRGLLGMVEVDAARKQYGKAMERLDAALQKNPEHNLVRLAWASMAVQAGRYPEAAAMFQKLIDAEPKNYELRMRLAETYRQQGDWGQAAEVWKTAAGLRPNELAPLINQAMAMEQSSRGAEAAAIYEQILRIDSSQLVALNNYAYFLAREGKDLDLALRHALRATILSPGEPQLADTLGFVYLKKKSYKEAAKVFEKLAGEFPKQAQFHIRLADAYKGSGDTEGVARECAAAGPLASTPMEKKELETVCAAGK